MTEKLVKSRSRAYVYVFVCVHVQDVVVSYLATFRTSVVYTIATFATCIHYVLSRNKNASENAQSHSVMISSLLQKNPVSRVAYLVHGRSNLKSGFHTIMLIGRKEKGSSSTGTLKTITCSFFACDWLWDSM